jgi:hypothetical protein
MLRPANWRDSRVKHSGIFRLVGRPICETSCVASVLEVLRGVTQASPGTGESVLRTVEGRSRSPVTPLQED